jgi:hypothetical protein
MENMPLLPQYDVMMPQQKHEPAPDRLGAGSFVNSADLRVTYRRPTDDSSLHRM